MWHQKLLVFYRASRNKKEALFAWRYGRYVERHRPMQALFPMRRLDRCATGPPGRISICVGPVTCRFTIVDLYSSFIPSRRCPGTEWGDRLPPDPWAYVKKGDYVLVASGFFWFFLLSFSFFGKTGRWESKVGRLLLQQSCSKRHVPTPKTRGCCLHCA